MPATFSALRSKKFLIYFLGYLPSVAGTFMQNAALGWLVYQMTQSNSAVSWVMSFLLFPTVLLMVPAGTIADRYDRRRLLLLTQSIALLQSLLVFATVASGHLSPGTAAALCALAGVCLAFEIPARVPMVCATVTEDQIGNALALNGLVFYGGLTVGRALAVVALGMGAYTTCFAINALSFVLELVALCLLPGSYKSTKPAERKSLSSIREGFTELWRDGASRRILIMIAVFGFFGMQFQPLVNGVSELIAKSPASAVAWLLSAVGVGQICGSVLLASKSNKEAIAKNLPMAYVFLALGVAVFGLAPNIYVGAVSAALIGCCIPLCVSGGNAVLQSRTPDERRGRATSIYFTVFLGSEPLGYLFGGAFADRFGIASALMLAGFALLVAAEWYTYRSQD